MLKGSDEISSSSSSRSQLAGWEVEQRRRECCGGGVKSGRGGSGGGGDCGEAASLLSSKGCWKSTSAVGLLLGRWSRSRPEMCVVSGNQREMVASSQRPLMRKCQTVDSLASEPATALPIHPYNRLRPQPGSGLLCSRCSSLLSMASSSRYSVNEEGQYVAVDPAPSITCKLCLLPVSLNKTWTLNCSCVFCAECIKEYVKFEINQGAYEISCPDGKCKSLGIITLGEIKSLVSAETMEKHMRYRRNREVDDDVTLAWCPSPGCETVCTVVSPQSPAYCPTCSFQFCTLCRNAWHPDITCPRLSSSSPPPIFDSDFIKFCPMCAIPIEKDEGCAQMMCKKCKHVFCWYCLTSLDDDFLLRHYDKGPCKNKLGHSRASVIWHRTQVIGIFAGFGILLLVASPLLLLAAPCIICCKCRVCTGDSRLDDDVPPDPSETPVIAGDGS